MTVAIMDIDVKEWSALIIVFPNIYLLICLFHLWQFIKNHHHHIVKGSTPLHINLKSHLERVKASLVLMTKHENTLSIIAKERVKLQSKRNLSNTAIIDGALEHLRYLENYWCSLNL